MSINKLTETKAIIFDMDGTLVDNMQFHIEAWLVFLKKHNILLNPREFQAQNRGNIDEMIRRFFGMEIPYEKVRELGQEKESIYRSSYRNYIKEIKGLTGFLTKMRENNIRAALATMGDMPNIDFILDELGIRSFFCSITGGHEITRGKPDPEIFELSLKKLGLSNKDCIVVEDSIDGVKSALNAGIKAIGITTSHNGEELRRNGCFYTMPDFAEMDWRIIL
jgi:beta-phosphoglucomutase